MEDGWLNVRDCGVSGSEFETTAATTDGSRQITVANVGDFKVGQGVMVSKCNIRYTSTQLWGTGLPYYNRKPVENSVEVRGFDGSAGSWVVYVLDIEPSSSPAFRWTDDLGHTWHPNVPITHDWQPLSGGVEVRLNQRDWESGYGGCAIRSHVGATQVIIRNNLFINFGSSVVEASGETDATHFPSGNTTITGNIFDMTCVGQKSLSRTAINVLTTRLSAITRFMSGVPLIRWSQPSSSANPLLM